MSACVTPGSDPSLLSHVKKDEYERQMKVPGMHGRKLTFAYCSLLAYDRPAEELLIVGTDVDEAYVVGEELP